jgi:hypothetical protein
LRNNGNFTLSSDYQRMIFTPNGFTLSDQFWNGFSIDTDGVTLTIGSAGMYFGAGGLLTGDGQGGVYIICGANNDVTSIACDESGVVTINYVANFQDAVNFGNSVNVLQADQIVQGRPTSL